MSIIYNKKQPLIVSRTCHINFAKYNYCQTKLLKGTENGTLLIVTRADYH